MVIIRDAYAGGQLPPLPSSVGAGGARIALHAELLPFLLPSEGAFSDVVDGWIQENFSKGKPPDPQITVVFLGDKYSKHCPSGKELEDQNLLLSRNMHIHRYALRGRLAPCLRSAQASLVVIYLFRQ